MMECTAFYEASKSGIQGLLVMRAAMKKAAR
jgi:hypothetical protein